MKAKPTTCRHCASPELYSREVKARGGYYGPDLLPIGGGLLFSPKLEIRVCAACGFVDWFVPQQHLSEVKEHFDPVN